MKRIFSYLLMALPMLMITSCDDDHDLPPVNVTIDVSGVTEVDNALYVVQEDGFEVDAVNLVNRGNKNAVIGATSYFWDGWHVGTTAQAPFAFEFNLDETQIGAHLFQVECSIYAVDYAPAVAQLSYKIHVVESADDIPGGVNPTNKTLTATVVSKD